MSTVRPPHMGYILDPDLLQRSSFRGHYTNHLGMSKAQIKAKHPPGTNPKHINAMHKYMTQDGLSFQQAHNKAEASGFPALGNTGLGHCNCAVPTCPSCGQKNLGRTSEGGFSTTEVLIIAFVVVPVLGWALGQ